MFANPPRELTAAEARKREILIAALRVISEQGIDAVTHRRVAGEAEVPLGSLTYYFESRDDMIREAFRFYIDEANRFILALEQEIPPTTPDGLIDLLLEIMKREFAEERMVRAEYELILHAARDEEVGRAFHSWERNLEARLSEALEVMGASRPHHGARTLLHLVRGFELQSLAKRAETQEQLRQRLVTVVGAVLSAEIIPRANNQSKHLNRSRTTPRPIRARRAR
jgi:TetR/AcrR family transcriptional regulator, regulator of biofilm formation and stress response